MKELFRRYYTPARLVAVVLMLALLAAARWLPVVEAQGPLAVAIGVWPGAETLVMARERGLIDERKVRFVEMPWDTAAMRAVGTGAVDAAVLSLDEVLRLWENGHDVRVVMVFDRSVGADAIVAEEAVKGAADLKGRRVGVDVRGTGMVLLASVLEGAGLRLTDVEAVPMSAPEMGVAFKHHDVEAVVCAEPWLSIISRDGGVRMAGAPPEPPLMRVLVVPAAALNRHEKTIARLAKAHFALVDELRGAGEVAARQAVFRRERLDEKAFLRALGGLELVGLEENERLLGREGKAALPGMVDKLEVFMRKHGLLTETLGGGERVNPSFLPRR